MCKDWKIHHVFRSRSNMGEMGLHEQLNANIEQWQEMRRIERENRKKTREVRIDE